MDTITIRRAQSGSDMATAADLMQAYKEALGLEVFDNPAQRQDEVLPGPYADAGAGILLGWCGGQPQGVVAWKGIGPQIAEMKRMYVAPEARGTGLGRALAEAVMAAARTDGYGRMQLDTLAWLKAACTLYESLGFERIPRYNDNPVPGVVFYGVAL